MTVHEEMELQQKLRKKYTTMPPAKKIPSSLVLMAMPLLETLHGTVPENFGVSSNP
jgi:hypothetical protein